MSGDMKEFDAHIRACLVIFGCLLVLTAVTVGVSYLDVPVAATITIALCIATTKGALVAGYFMHLISEKRLIFISLALTFFFFLVLMILPVATLSDHIRHMVWRTY